MNIKYIEDRVQAIEQARADAEIAHSLEDGLYRDFIRCVASGDYAGDVKVLAEAVLKSDDIDFPRWCA